MPLTVLSPPATLPVSLVQIKQHLRIDHLQDDAYLLELGEAATAHCEAVTRRMFVERTLRQYVDGGDVGPNIPLEAFPVISIEQVTAYDGEGNPQILPQDAYSLIPGTDPACIRLDAMDSGTDWANGLEIDYVAGYGASLLEVPSNAIRALLVLIGHWYEHRGTHSSLDQTALIPDGFERLLAPLRRVRL